MHLRLGASEATSDRVLGTRGIPANYGGFETFYDNLATRLVARGYVVTVYNRPHGVKDPRRRQYAGVRLIPLPSIRTKHLDTIRPHGCEHPPWPDPALRHRLRLRRRQQPDRLDPTPRWLEGHAQRGQRRLETLEVGLRRLQLPPRRRAHRRPDRERRDRRQRHDPRAIPRVLWHRSGLHPVRRDDRTGGIDPGARRLRAGAGTVRSVGRRLEPETTIEDLFEAFSRLAEPGLSLVVVGDAPYADDFKERLRKIVRPTWYSPAMSSAMPIASSAHTPWPTSELPTSGTAPRSSTRWAWAMRSSCGGPHRTMRRSATQGWRFARRSGRRTPGRTPTIARRSGPAVGPRPASRSSGPGALRLGRDREWYEELFDQLLRGSRVKA